MQDDVVVEHCKFVSHKLEIHVDLVEVAFATNQDVLIAFDDITSLLKHGSKHVERAVEHVFVLVA